ncbi:class C beta-lactamase [Congregicoccus parvus]|uniref:class C beta-lactamase n=1 Tax=Congregicoccus parvus TaxID=3081749 RepID=UPI003FA55B25
MLRVILAGVVLAYAPSSLGREDDAGTRLEHVSEVVARDAPLLMSEHGIPGLVVGVTVRGETRVFPFGLADRERGIPVTEATLFEVGSVSKTFTATVAALAQAEGRLSLSDHPSVHWPELAGTSVDRATLAELGAYSAAGFPLQFPANVGDEDSLLRFFREWVAPAPPGGVRVYSNPSIGLLGRLTARALGKSFVRAVEDDLLPRLGLHETYIDVPDRAALAYAWGYDGENRRVRVSPGPLDAEAYGIKSNASDLLRYLEIQSAAEDAEGPLGEALRTTQSGFHRVGTMTQGLGWEHYAYPTSLDTLLEGNSPALLFQPNEVEASVASESARLFNKTGSTRGFGAYLLFVPAERVGIVVLANKNYPIPARIRLAHAVLEAVASP